VTVYRGTLCGWQGCEAEATHFLRVLAPKHGAPLNRAVPMDVLISAEVCEAHADKQAFAAEVKEAGLIDQVQAFCRAAGIAPVNMRYAVVRLIRKEDGDFAQYTAN
jgi:hypothetical protein